MTGDLSGRLATMLGAMPYATAAKFAFPERTVVCTIGDGAFQMLGMNELITVKRHLESWDENPQFIVVVLHNDDLTQVSWEMRTMDADPLWPTAQDVESVDYAGWAELLGFTGLRVTDDDEIEEAMETAFAHRGVTLIDVRTSRSVPPLPPRISREFAKNTGVALLQDDPARTEVLRDSAKALLAEGVERARRTMHIDHERDPG